MASYHNIIMVQVRGGGTELIPNLTGILIPHDENTDYSFDLYNRASWPTTTVLG